jgi:hypothetical protein
MTDRNGPGLRARANLTNQIRILETTLDNAKAVFSLVSVGSHGGCQRRQQAAQPQETTMTTFDEIRQSKQVTP